MDINDREKYIGSLIDNGDFRDREDFDFFYFLKKKMWLKEV